MAITVFITDHYHPSGPKVIAQHVSVVYPTDPRVSSWPNEADYLMVRSDRLLPADILRSKKLKGIVKQGVGVDSIPLDECRQKGIIVCNTPGINAETVAEYSISLALTIARRTAELDRRIRRGERIIRSNMLGKSLYGKTIGIVGMGAIGLAAAKKWTSRAFDATILAYDPYVDEKSWNGITYERCDSLEDMLARGVDVLTLHVPLTFSTRGIIGERELKLLGPEGILINAARGGIVDESALLHALENKWILGAGIDVFEKEPITREHYSELLKLDNVVVSAHVGASTVENQVNSSLAVADVLLDIITGKEIRNRIV